MRNDTKVDKHAARLAHVACRMLFKLKRSVEITHDVTDVIHCIQKWLTEQETGSLMVPKVLRNTMFRISRVRTSDIDHRTSSGSVND